MIALKSIDRIMEAEDEAVKQDTFACMREFHDGVKMPDTKDEEMRIMAARDVHVYQKPTNGDAKPEDGEAEPTDPRPPEKEEPPKSPEKETPPAAQPKNGWSLGKYAAATAIGAGLLGAGALGMHLLSDKPSAQPPPVQQDLPGRYTDRGLGFDN